MFSYADIFSALSLTLSILALHKNWRVHNILIRKDKEEQLSKKQAKLTARINGNHLIILNEGQSVAQNIQIEEIDTKLLSVPEQFTLCSGSEKTILKRNFIGSGDNIEVKITYDDDESKGKSLELQVHH